jgi:hypothetical protein
MNEAVAQLRNGLRLLSGVPDGTIRQEYELDLQIALGHALIAIKGYSAPEAGAADARARLLCDQLDSPSQLGPILYGQYMRFATLRGELAQAEHDAAEMRQLGAVSNDGIWKCFGEFVSGNAACWLGKFPRFARLLGECSLLMEPHVSQCAGLAGGFERLDSDMAFCYLACLGHVVQARLRRDEALTDARPLAPLVPLHIGPLVTDGSQKNKKAPRNSRGAQ